MCGGHAGSESATQKAEEWVKGFLAFYNFQPPPLHDPANSQALFDGGTTTVDVVIDRALRALALLDAAALGADVQR